MKFVGDMPANPCGKSCDCTRLAEEAGLDHEEIATFIQPQLIPPLTSNKNQPLFWSGITGIADWVGRMLSGWILPKVVTIERYSPFHRY